MIREMFMGGLRHLATALGAEIVPRVGGSRQSIATSIADRYRNEKWALLVGNTADKSPTTSTYAFMRDVVGYDLAKFFERNKKALQKEVDAVLTKLLSPEE